MADSPSRFDYKKLFDAGAIRCEVDGPICWGALTDLFEKWGEHQAVSEPQFQKR
jgi:hypothetical protein